MKKQSFYTEHVLRPKEEDLRKRDQQQEKDNNDYLKRAEERDKKEKAMKDERHRKHLQEIEK